MEGLGEAHGKSGGSVHCEPIANAWLGPEVARARRVGLELAPELEHEDAQIVRLIVVVRPPDLSEQLSVGNDVAGMPHEGRQELVLDRCEVDLGVSRTETRRRIRSTWSSPRAKTGSARWLARAAWRSTARMRASSSPIPKGLLT